MPRSTRWFDTLMNAGGGRYVSGRNAAPMCRRQGFVALVAAGLLTGCGQRGPLTLPTRDVEAANAPAAEEQVTDAEQESEEDEE